LFGLPSEKLGKDEIVELTEQVKILNTKIDAMDGKLAKIEENSTAIINNTKHLIESSEFTRTNEILSNTISDPNGFIARELSNQLYVMLEKYQSTNFRRWAATRGRTVVEATIAQFVSRQVPMLNWYGVSISKINDKEYHQKAKTSFPVDLNTGIPIIGKITLAKCIFDIEADVDIDSKQVKNLKTVFTTEQIDKQIFTSFIEDIDGSLKTHKRVYGVLSPIGRGINNIWLLMKRETNFSYPFLFMFLSAYILGFFWPTYEIWVLLRFPYVYGGLLGIGYQRFLWGLFNGALYGAVIWVAVRYKLLEKMQATSPLIKQLTTINQPGGIQVDIKIVAIGTIVVLAVFGGGWWLMQPKTMDVNAVRSYSDQISSSFLSSMNTNNYDSTSSYLSGNTKNTVTVLVYPNYRASIQSNYGNFTGYVFWKAAFENNVPTIYYNATYSKQPRVVARFVYVDENQGHKIVSVNFLNSSFNLNMP
jgi:hypothetical protein